MSLKSTSCLRRILLKGILIVLLACVVVVILLSLWIELHLKKTCEMAKRKYSGDKVEALMMFVESKEYGYNAHLYRANNHAIWALGQLGDKRALPFLRNLLTGEPCDHETNLCQGEIQEAIQILERNQFNLPKFLWRGVLNYEFPIKYNSVDIIRHMSTADIHHEYILLMEQGDLGFLSGTILVNWQKRK